MIRHQPAQSLAPASVERGEGLVHQPQRARGGDQSGQGQATALASRQLARLQIQQGGEAQDLLGADDAGRVRAQPAGLEIDFLAGQALALEPVLMAEEVEPVTRLGRRLAADEDVADVGADESRD